MIKHSNDKKKKREIFDVHELEASDLLQYFCILASIENSSFLFLIFKNTATYQYNCLLILNVRNFKQEIFLFDHSF